MYQDWTCFPKRHSLTARNRNTQDQSWTLIPSAFSPSLTSSVLQCQADFLSPTSSPASAITGTRPELGGELAAQGLRMCLALPWQELVLAVEAIAWWPRACGLLYSWGGELAPLRSHCRTNSPFGVMGLREGSVWLSNFAWEAGRRRETVVRHYRKILPKKAKTEERGTPTMNLSQ